jgi:hypothetical protein
MDRRQRRQSVNDVADASEFYDKNSHLRNDQEVSELAGTSA